MIEALRSVRYSVGDLSIAGHWYSQLLDMQPYSSGDSVLRYCVDGSWLELVASQAANAPSDGAFMVYWGVDSLHRELARLHGADIKPQTSPALLDAATRTATFVDPFGNTVGLVEIHDPDAQRARAHRAAEKIALRNVRTTLDGLGDEDNQQRNANRVVAVVVMVALVLAALGLWRLLPTKPQEPRIVIPLSGASH